ncbi:MAG TPA: bacteriocin fulvocin C-related protein [Flavipsychrobacter sp.]|nr:bacteriocin fulvocin C-related protein [Flavipsychrobacter sp.]
MKTTLFRGLPLAFCIALSLYFSACQKSNIQHIPITNNTDSNRKHILMADVSQITLQEFDSYPDSVQIQIYNQMDDTEKSNLWQARVQDVINGYKGNGGSSAAISALQKLQSLITVHLFDEGPDTARDTIEAWVNATVNANIAGLTYNDIRNITTSFLEIGSWSSGGPVWNFPPPADGGPCGCCIVDDWCSGSKRCNQSLPCSDSPTGCGLIWLSPCDGKCG